MMNRKLLQAFACAAALSFTLALRGKAVAVQPDFFPLKAGNTWTYEPYNLGDPPPGLVIWKTRVLWVKDDLSLLRYEVLDFVRDRKWTKDLLIKKAGDVVLLIGSLVTPGLCNPPMQEDEFVLYYDFSLNEFIHRDYYDCNDHTTVNIGGRDEVVQTFAGVFNGCRRLGFNHSCCSDVNRHSDYWCPDFGLVRWSEGNGIGDTIWLLTSFEELGPPWKFQRGDVNGDGALQLSDAVSILGFLFLGTLPPFCEDAADVNDDGMIDIGDPVFLLGYLFLGTPLSIPAPSGACGVDPTEDNLPCDFSPPCFPTE